MQHKGLYSSTHGNVFMPPSSRNNDFLKMLHQHPHTHPQKSGQRFQILFKSTHVGMCEQCYCAMGRWEGVHFLCMCSCVSTESLAFTYVLICVSELPQKTLHVLLFFLSFPSSPSCFVPSTSFIPAAERACIAARCQIHHKCSSQLSDECSPGPQLTGYQIVCVCVCVHCGSCLIWFEFGKDKAGGLLTEKLCVSLSVCVCVCVPAEILQNGY